MYSIETSNLKKKFTDGKKAVWALKGIDLKVKKGEIFGLLGPNGAGKTTTIQILSTLLLPTSGKAKVMGHDVVKDPREVARMTGLVTGGMRLYWDMNAKENLEYFGRLYGVPKKERRLRTVDLIKRFGITKFRNRPFSDLSTGMRQKVVLAKSLINNPRVLFLDEPTAGLDVEVAQNIRNLIMQIAKETDMTIILTSHVLYEVEEMCDRISIIKKGRIFTKGTVNQIRKRLGFPDIIKIYMDKYGDMEFLKDIEGVLDVEVGDGLRLEVSSSINTVSPILAKLKRRRYTVKDIEVNKANLKDMFLQIIK